MNAPRQPLDKLKLIALAACGVLFLACCGVGGLLVYLKYTRPLPAQNTLRIPPQPVDITADLKGAHDKGKELYQIAKDALDKEDLPVALENFNAAKDIWNANADKLAELLQQPEYQGKEYIGWNGIATQLQSNLVVVKNDIFKLEQRIARQKNAAAAANTPEAPFVPKK